MLPVVREGWTVLATWPSRRWLLAVVSGLGVAVLVALPTAVIPNPVFGRSVGVTWFAPFQPFLAIASVVLMFVALRIRLVGTP
jgi:hypothetical protein